MMVKYNMKNFENFRKPTKRDEHSTNITSELLNIEDAVKEFRLEKNEDCDFSDLKEYITLMKESIMNLETNLNDLEKLI